MIEWVFKKLITNMCLSLVGVGIYILIAKVFTAGTYTTDYWETVRFVFYVSCGIDVVVALYKIGNKGADW